MLWMPLTIHTLESSRFRCAKRTFPALQTPTNWTAGTHAGRPKRCRLRHKVAQSVEAPTANGLDQDHHLRRGKTATGDMAHKTEAHPGLIEDPEATIGGRCHMITDTQLAHLASEDQTGATAQMRDMARCRHCHLMVDTPYHPFLDTDQETTAAGRHQPVATPTYPAMAAVKARDGPASPTTDRCAMDRATPAIRAKASWTSAPVGVERTATGPETRGRLLGRGEMGGRVRGVPSGVVSGIVTAMTSTAGDDVDWGGAVFGSVEVLSFFVFGLQMLVGTVGHDKQWRLGRLR